MRFNFKIGSLEFGYLSELRIRFKQNQEVLGYTNRTMDGKFIVILDYDDKYSAWYMLELQELQKIFKLSDFYIFITNKGFHAVCFDKLSMRDYLRILELSSCDYNYKNVPLAYGRKMWVLRITQKDGQKPKLAHVIHSTNMIYRQSYAHANLINNLLKTNIKLIKPDNITKLISARYWI